MRRKAVLQPALWLCFSLLSLCVGPASSEPEPGPSGGGFKPSTGCLYQKSDQILKKKREELNEIKISLSHLVELFQLYLDLQTFDIQLHKNDNNKNWIMSKSLHSLLAFGGPIPMAQFLTADSNNMQNGVWACLDYYYMELPGTSSFCAKASTEELSFDKPCTDNLDEYRTENEITEEPSSAHSLSLLVERQKRQKFIPLDEVNVTIAQFVGVGEKESVMFFKLRSDIETILRHS